MKMAYGRLCAVAILVLGGCTSTPSPSTAPTSPAAPLPTSASAPAALSTTPGRAAGVTVERTGGFAGVDQSISVEPDGRWIYYRNRAGAGGGTPIRGRLNEDLLADLQALLAAPELGREVGESADCADGFVYTLVTGATKVQWSDCGSGMPPTATRVVELLSTSTPF